MLTSETAPKKAPRFGGLDLLRLLSVLGVIVYHYGYWGPAVHGATHVAIPQLAPFAMYGYLGVSVFFTISGFVIAYSADGRTTATFAIARFSRIYPTFVLCMTLTALLTLAFGQPTFDVTLTQWLANLFVAATVLHQPYMDSAYWSLVIEIVFYLWIALLIATRLFPSRIDLIVLAWLAISLLNELTVDAVAIEKVFLADDSGFFATGLLLYELCRGRRDPRLYALLVLAVGIAVFQAIHKLGRLTDHGADPQAQWTVAVICLISIAAIALATRMRRTWLPADVTLALGGLTYPLYLLHQKAGYVVLERLAPSHVIPAVLAIIAAISAISWAIWRYIEPVIHDRTKTKLMQLAGRISAKTPAQCGGVSRS